MKKSILLIAAALFTLGMTSCTDEPIVNPNNNVTPEVSNVRVKTTADLNNTSWTYSMTYSQFIAAIAGVDTSCIPNYQDETFDFGLEFDGTYAHFTFPTNIEAWAGDTTGMQQIYGINYEYSYDGSTHTGYLMGTIEDDNGNDVPSNLQFTYDDATDVITFVLPLIYAEDNTPFNYTMNFHRNE